MKIIDAVFVYQMRNINELQWHGRTHSHGENEYEIHYFLGGMASLSTIKRVIPSLKEPCMFLFPILCTPLKQQLNIQSHIMQFSYALMHRRENLVNFRETKNNVPYTIGTNYRFFFKEVKDKALSDSHNRHQSACHQIASLMYLVQDGGRGMSTDNDSRHLEKALRIMQTHVMDNLTLFDLAQELKLTESYFIRLFGARMRQSPMKYYMKLKIEAASALLTCTDLSVKEIAAKLSFSSEFHFSKQFKSKTGLAPTYYRRNYIQQLGPTARVSLEEND